MCVFHTDLCANTGGQTTAQADDDNRRGAGSDGCPREFRASTHSENKVVCLIDDDKSKWGQYLLGVKVVGGRGDILGAVKKYDIDEIIMAMPSASIRMRSEILDICKVTRAGLKRFGYFSACERRGQHQ